MLSSLGLIRQHSRGSKAPHEAASPSLPSNPPIADTLLGEAFLRLFPGPLLYMWCLALPLSVLISALGSCNAGAALQLVARLAKAQGWVSLSAVADSSKLATALSLALSFTTPIYIFVAIPLLDLLLGRDLRDPAPEAAKGPINRAQATLDALYRVILHAYVPIHYVVLLVAARVACAGGLHPLAALGVALSAGLSGGMLFTVAHELLHGSPFDRACANALLALVGYMHWSESHLAHHIKVGTPEDPASARRGESLYAFFPRTIWGNLVDGYAIEAQRLAATGTPLLSLHNRMLLWIAGPLVPVAAAFWSFGWAGVGFMVLQALAAIFMLETVNYIEHYGLTRKKLPSGRYERVGPCHSWTAAHIFTNATVFRLQRHADHHEFARKPYQALRDLPDSSQLPADYPALMIAAMAPPLFFHIMHPLLDKFESSASHKE